MARNIILIITLFSVGIITAGCGLKPEVITTTSVSTQTETVQADLGQLEKNYENDVKTIMAPYWQGQNFSGIKDKILALKAPSKYLDLHLNLVIGLELIEQGQATSDQEKIETGMDKINQLLAQYSFIK
ncbi:MAG: hypothetical protein WCX71_03880 [Candidatus Buchananbacteria bacterium]